MPRKQRIKVSKGSRTKGGPIDLLIFKDTKTKRTSTYRFSGVSVKTMKSKKGGRFFMNMIRRKK